MLSWGWCVLRLGVEEEGTTRGPYLPSPQLSLLTSGYNVGNRGTEARGIAKGRA